MATKGTGWWLLGLIGYPLDHSLSPCLHEAALKKAGLEGEYRLFPLQPGVSFEHGLKRLLETVVRSEIDGLNVTIPHKQTVIPYLDMLSKAATAVKAVNTIFFDKLALVGDNTDIEGFLVDLHRELNKYSTTAEKKGPSNKTALILGAGGAARSVVYGLVNDGWQVLLAARRESQLVQLLISLGSPGEVQVLHLDFEVLNKVVHGEFGEVKLVVNTTPVGMWPNVNETPWPENLSFPEESFIYDLVYNPFETRLIRNARESGRGAVNGLGMLIEQAALSFEKWTGFAANRQAMWEAINPSFLEKEDK